jgi:hypothetical protein
MVMSAEVTLHDKFGSGVASGAAELSSLDYNCLQFCVSLLDHDLKASIFESSRYWASWQSLALTR